MSARLALTLPGVLVLACATASPTVGPGALTARDYVALQPGTQWTYDVVQLGQKATQVVRIVRQVDGFTEDSTGARFKVDAFGVRDQLRYLLRNPVRVGTRWSAVVSVSAAEKYEIVSEGKPCATPAGSFQRCVTVVGALPTDRGETLLNELTFAQGVGLVQVETSLVTKGGGRVPQTSLLLRNFVPGGQGPDLKP